MNKEKYVSDIIVGNKKKMTNREARRRIVDHMIVHHMEEPRAILITEALEMAIEALEKATPKKPYLKYDDFGDGTLSCPTCKSPIVNVWSTKKYNPNYCHYCGQKLDWEVEE